MKCQKCHHNEATIHIKELGDFCLSCHNEMMAELQGMEQPEVFPKNLSVKAADGHRHRFIITTMILPGMVIWRAVEKNGGYEFVYHARPADNQTTAFERLLEKIEQGLSYQSLESEADGPLFDNAIEIDAEQFGLKAVGTFRIAYDSQADTASLIIDGKAVALDDWGRALTAYEGFNMDYQIRDMAEAVLGPETVLKPVSINPDQIEARFKRTLGWFLEDGFLSTARASACEDALYDCIDDLKLLCQYGDRETAQKLGKRISKRLLAVANDDDSFPDYLLTLIDAALAL